MLITLSKLMPRGYNLSLGITIAFNPVTGQLPVRLDAPRLHRIQVTKYRPAFALRFILALTIVSPPVLANTVAQGFFNAYGSPVRRDSVDYVLHLGDYIYDYAEGECKETKMKALMVRRIRFTARPKAIARQKHHHVIPLPDPYRRIPH
jgi:hypothetical protein